MAKSFRLLELSLVGLFIVIISESSSAEQITESAFSEIVHKLLEENKQLRLELKNLHHLRDVEADIEEIKKILEGYGEDLTALRIQQGHLEETVDQHETDLLDHSTQLANHTETMSQQNISISANRADIDSHNQTLNTHGNDIQWTIGNINNFATLIPQLQNSIAVNGQNIQSVTDNFNNFLGRQVKFYAESGCCDIEKWPDNARITYQNVPIDTHGAISDGQFHTPITGIYTFTFTADFRIYDDRPEFASVRLNVNDNKIRSYLFDSKDNDEIYFSFSISFTLRLNQGDRVDLSTSGEPCLDFSRNPAAFHGYLLQAV